ncbi:hypothetical protein F5Y17DRAFT_368681 [Xylariaceae sp. FL0594]|nr:hypothetical protein F5Y17DRAFT_368681 [Xylariaceae sp. FL0594]
MHPAPSLAESFPKSTKAEDRAKPQHVYDSHQPQPSRLVHTTAAAAHQGHAALLKLESRSDYSVSQPSPIMRKDTGSSASTHASSDTTAFTASSTDTSATASSVQASLSIFSVVDGSEIPSSRRASRRRTGPLSAAQREKAALIRKLGACVDCRRRRVACHPTHHGMSWEDAVQKYRSSSPLQELATLAGRPLSPATTHMMPPPSGPSPYARTSHEMDVDVPAAALPRPRPSAGRTSPNEPRINRTPLPSGPRMERQASVPNALTTPPALYSALPRPVSVKHELESAASKALSSPDRGRYASAYALLIFWEDEQQTSIAGAVEELAEVFQKCYRYTPEIARVPSPPLDGYANPSRWLTRIMNEFIDKNDTRDTLKIVYYSGASYLDENREMVLSSSRNREKTGIIRWNGIQHILEEANSDTLVIMDSMYYPAMKMTRRNGVLELIAASAPDEYYNTLRLERGIFTHALADQLRARASQQYRYHHPHPTSSSSFSSPSYSPSGVLSAAELHAKLFPVFPKLVAERYPEKGLGNMSFPAPLHMQASGNARLPSITLSPLPPPLQLPKPHQLPGVGKGDHGNRTGGGPQVTLSMRLTDESAFSVENWAEWFRMMPEGIQDVKVEVPYPFR